MAARPGSADPASLLGLQRTVGNAAVVSLLRSSVAPPPSSPPPGDRGGLPGALRTALERQSGFAMDDVAVHRHSPEPARIGAEAFTRGSDIFLAPGKEGHLPHEAWHVVQQRAGRVTPTLIVGPTAVNADPSLEREADDHGAALATVAAESTASEQRPPATLRRVQAASLRPVVQGVFTKAQLRHIMKMSQSVRVEYLSHLSPKDLDEVAEKTNLFERFGGSEEADEVRSVRKQRGRGAGYRRQWLGALPPGNAREAARLLAHVGDQAETTEESDAQAADKEAFLALIQGRIRIVYVEDCALEDEPDEDDEDSTPEVGPARRVLPGDHEMAFTPPAPTKSLFLLGSVIASRDDPVTAWADHLRRGFVQSGEMGDIPGRYGPEDDDGMDELITQMGKMTLGAPTSTPQVTPIPSLTTSPVPTTSATGDLGGPAPMDIDDDAMDVDIAADITRVVIRGIRLPTTTELPGGGLVPMEIDSADAMDIDVDNPFEADVEMSDAEGSLNMEVDADGGITAVYGTIAMHMDLVGEEGEVSVVFMDIDVDGMDVEEDDTMDISRAEEGTGGIEVEVSADPEDRRLRAEFLTYRDPTKKRKTSETPTRPPPMGGSSTAESSPVVSSSDEEVDALAEEFSNLRITFYSDVDRGAEEHSIEPDPSLNEIMVASNPVPLKTILGTQTWLGQTLATGILSTLTKLAATAATEMATYATKRTKGQGKALRSALRDIAKVLKSANTAAKFPKPDLSTSVDYGVNSGDVEGSHVIAQKLSMNMKAIHGHGPSANGRLMKAIRKRAPGNEGSSYFQMHLLNDNVFGPGELWNLTPGPAKSNSVMQHGVETLLKRAIIDKALVIDFEAVVHYRTDPKTASQTDLDQDPDKYRFDKITFSATQYDWSGTAWVASTKPDPDVKGINASSSVVKWNWGSLTPLKSKPRILSTTSVDELVGIGMTKGMAARVVAFNKYNAANSGAYAVTQKSRKKDDLETQLKQYEIDILKKKSPKVMGWDQWKADAVLWS
ncbi:MAG TPA: DUF4157 domain-containing protein [Acidimicrobiales bacterium]|nr:DUF4157 domain-containing protein [Acidimicrobiales bacterium]